MFYLRDVNVKVIVMAIGNRSFLDNRFYTRSLLNHVVSITNFVLVTCGYIVCRISEKNLAVLLFFLMKYQHIS